MFHVKHKERRLLMEYKDIVIKTLTEKITGLEQYAINLENEVKRLNEELSKLNTKTDE